MHRAPVASSSGGTAMSRVPAMIAVAGSASIRLLTGVRQRLSAMMRRGCPPGTCPSGQFGSCCPRWLLSSLTFMAGLSANTVPMPVRMAEERALHFCTSRRETSLLIHLLSPLPSAVLPSRLIAVFTLTQGRPLRMRMKNPGLRASASPAIKPVSTARPALRNSIRPWPFTCGLGSADATTMRDTPALNRAPVQGGVRP